MASGVLLVVPWLIFASKRAGAGHSVRTRATIRTHRTQLRHCREFLQIADLQPTPDEPEFHEDGNFASLVLPSSAHSSMESARSAEQSHEIPFVDPTGHEDLPSQIAGRARKPQRKSLLGIGL
jgi:hypothetical protein